MISLKKLLFEQTNSDVELIQQKLRDLEYNIGTTGPKGDGVDGILGKRTLDALDQYKTAKVPSAAKATDPEVLKSLTGQTIDLSSQLTSQGSGTSDFNSFKTQLAGALGIRLTDEKSRFFDAWRAVENTKATNNPFATTLNYKKDPGMTKFNLANRGQGVKNFSTLDHGVDATAITMKLRYYSSLIEKLKNDNISAIELAKDQSLDTWGTGSAKIQKVLGSGGTTTTDPEKKKTTTTDPEKEKQTTATHNVKRNNEGWIISDKKSVYGRLAKIKKDIDEVILWKDINSRYVGNNPNNDIDRFTGNVTTSTLYNKRNTWYDHDLKLTIKGIKFIKIPEFKSRSGKTDKASGKVYSYLWVVGAGTMGWIQSNQVDTLAPKK